MPSDHHESPPAPSAPDDPDESSSIGDSSLLAPPMSRRQLHPYPVPQSDLQGLHSFIDDNSVLPDPSATLATTAIPGSPPAHSVPMRAVTHPDYPDGISMPNSRPLSPHTTWFHARTPLSSGLPPQQPVVYSDGYAPTESLPPQNYIVPARTMPPLSAPPPASHGTSLLSQAHLPAPPVISIPSPTVLVPPNSELARPPRFTFAPPGADVPADPVVSATTVSPTSVRSRREKAKGRPDKASQPTQEGSDRRARSHSWSVVPSVFRRISGRQPGPATPTPATDVRPQLTACDWRDLAKWAYRPADNNWGESFAARSPLTQIQLCPSRWKPRVCMMISSPLSRPISPTSPLPPHLFCVRPHQRAP
ncbi:hypothetical protein BJV78DRAFT_88309 [Lactifluus subvellereus]|nr:hypothetical protein BJV78DRAFT_88309 [Lactifluus subvellereus]